MRTTTIFAQTHTSERTMSPTGLYCFIIKFYWLPGLCKMYPRVGLRAALQAYDTRMFVIRKIGLHHALYKGKL